MATEEGIKPGEAYVLSVQWNRYKYKTYYKTFNDEAHFNNWYDFITNRGGKVIGVTLKIKEDEDR